LLRWATTPYFGVNACLTTNSAGQNAFVRFRFVPAAGEHYPDPDMLAGKSADYLREEIVDQVARGPVEFTWYAQVAEEGDDIADPSTPWPESRKLVKLGVITIDRDAANTELADTSLRFLLGTTPLGSAQPTRCLRIRNAAYPISFAERR
jgi:catalase